MFFLLGGFIRFVATGIVHGRPNFFWQVNVFMIRYVRVSSVKDAPLNRLSLGRVTSFPILLLIALHERQSKKNGTIGFYETIVVAAERIYDTLPRQLKRMSQYFSYLSSHPFITEHFSSLL